MSEKKKDVQKEKMMEERKAEHKALCDRLSAEGYTARNATVSIVKANLLAFATAGPIAVLFIILFIAFGSPDMSFSELIRSSVPFLIFAAAIIISIPVHEGIHGLGWVSFCKNKFRSIEFGVMWSSLTPYCHCREELTVGQYYIGLLAPLTILGIIPCIISLFSGSIVLLAVGVMNILSAGGDTTIGCLLFRYIGKKVRIADHPTECGCVVFEK